jgi:hypothetical protein
MDTMRDSAQTKDDFYKLYDEKTCRIQVDMAR